LTKKNLYVWACDYSENSGEGKLARLFIKKLNLDRNFRIIINKNYNVHRYISPIIGIIFCWLKSLKNQKTCYLNYLPFWNFLIFMLLPSKTILGPITGGAHYSKKNILNFIIRDKVFPILYRLSEGFLIKRKTKKIFSTNLTKKHLSSKLIKNSEFNFILKSFKKQKLIKKDIEFLIYYRKHNNKNDIFQQELIKKLITLNVKVIVIGDRLNFKGVRNMGFKKNNIVQKLQARAKFAINSEETIYSFFTLECLSNNVQILINKKYKNDVKFMKKKFIFINPKKITGFIDYKNIIKSD
jgi:hypothetical protein